MPILAITITKPQADSRLGVTFNVTDEAVYVKEADEGGTDLRRGQEVLRINESSMQNIGAGGFRTVLASLPAGDVIFIVKSRASPNGITFKVENKNISAKMKTAIKWHQLSLLPSLMLKEKRKFNLSLDPCSIMLAYLIILCYPLSMRLVPSSQIPQRTPGRLVKCF